MRCAPLKLTGPHPPRPFFPPTHPIPELLPSPTPTCGSHASNPISHHAGVMLVNTQGEGSASLRSSVLYQPIPKPSPLRFPCPRWNGSVSSRLRSRASYCKDTDVRTLKVRHQDTDSQHILYQQARVRLSARPEGQAQRSKSARDLLPMRPKRKISKREEGRPRTRPQPD